MKTATFRHYGAGEYVIEYPEEVKLVDKGDYYYGEFKFTVKFNGWTEFDNSRRYICAPCGWCNDYRYEYEFYGIYEAYSQLKPSLQLFIPKYNLAITGGAGLVGKGATKKFKGCEVIEKGTPLKDELTAYIKIPKDVIKDYPPENDRYYVNVEVHGTLYFNYVTHVAPIPKAWCAESAKKQGISPAYIDCRTYGRGDAEHHWCDMSITVVLGKAEETKCPYSSAEDVYKEVCDFLKTNPSKTEILDKIIYYDNKYFDCESYSDIKNAILQAIVDLTNLHQDSVSLSSLIYKYCKTTPPPVEEPKCVFVDKASEVYIVIKQTGEMFYPGTELTVLHGATLLCCGLIKNEGADGTCGMFVFDKNSGEYLDGVTKFLKSGDMWLASVELTPSPGDYVLEFHAVHLEDGRRVVDDKA